MDRHFEIVECLGTVKFEDGWSKELRLISWDDHEPGFDIRNWKYDDRMTRGITLTKEEMQNFYSSYLGWKERGNSIERAKKDPSFVLDEGVLKVTIYSHIGTLKRNGDWSREVNVTSWNDGEPKIDIREWLFDHTRMTRGLTVTEEEADRICSLYWEHVKKQTTETLFDY